MKMNKSIFDNNIVISFSLRSMFFILLGFVLLWVVYVVKTVIIMLFIALILALAIQPMVDWLKERKVNHVFAVTITVAVFVIIFLGLFSIAIIPFIQQLQGLVIRFPLYFNSLINDFPIDENVYLQKFNEAFIDNISKASGNIVNVTLSIFSSLLNFVLTVAFLIYILLDFDNLRDYFINFIPKKKRNDTKEIVLDLEFKLGSWLRGQALLMFIIGVMTYIGLIFLGVPYALALAVIAGLLEIVPYIGPIISVIPAAILGFVISPFIGFAVIGLYLLVQQLESNFIVPKVMQSVTGLNPLVTIIALMVGAEMLGVIGAILAVPFTLIILEVIKYLVDKDK